MTNFNIVTKEFTNKGNPTLMIWDKTNNTLGYADMAAPVNDAAIAAEPVKVASVDNCVRQGELSLGGSSVGLGGVSLFTDATDGQIGLNGYAAMAKPTAGPTFVTNHTDSCYQQPTSISFGICAVGKKSISINPKWEDDRSAPVCQPG